MCKEKSAVQKLIESTQVKIDIDIDFPRGSAEWWDEVSTRLGEVTLEALQTGNKSLLTELGRVTRTLNTSRNLAGKQKGSQESATILQELPSSSEDMPEFVAKVAQAVALGKITRWQMDGILQLLKMQLKIIESEGPSEDMGSSEDRKWAAEQAKKLMKK